jgi:hypothetical protein
VELLLWPKIIKSAVYIVGIEGVHEEEVWLNCGDFVTTKLGSC